MKTRILVVDDSNEVIDLLREHFGRSDNFEGVMWANNGEDGMRIIKDKHKMIDIILLDLVMPSKDGFYILEEMKKYGINKKVIIISNLVSPQTISKVSKYNISYFIPKPFDLKYLENKILECVNEDNSNNNIIKNVTKILHDLGMPSNIKGYNYVRDAINLIYNDPSLIGAVTKNLYPEIAIRYKTTSSRVERAIRHAIEVSWIRADWDLMSDIFGNSVDIDRAKPTNSEFIVTIADKLRLDTINV